ncbi:MAG: 4Fe-4S binding protein [Promethearchaeota archaeon]
MKENKQWSETELLDFTKRWHAITIPVNIQIEHRQIALNLNRTNQIIMKAEKIALGDCVCRKTLKNCSFPQETCIFLNSRAETLVKNGRAKYITPEQAKLIVSETHKLGLVHLAMYQLSTSNQFPSEICSCCPCCCQALQGLQRLNMRGLVEPSEYVSTFDSELCIQCGICTERCHFGARMLDAHDEIIYKQNLCFGCGLCVSSCPESAIKLIPRDSWGKTP